MDARLASVAAVACSYRSGRCRHRPVLRGAPRFTRYPRRLRFRAAFVSPRRVSVVGESPAHRSPPLMAGGRATERDAPCTAYQVLLSRHDDARLEVKVIPKSERYPAQSRCPCKDTVRTSMRLLPPGYRSLPLLAPPLYCVLCCVRVFLGYIGAARVTGGSERLRRWAQLALQLRDARFEACDAG